MSRVSYPLAANQNASAAIANIVITYTTDDPATVADSAITIADGDATAGMAAALDEFEAKVNAILGALRNAGIVAT
jgi:hypothetical protein